MLSYQHGYHAGNLADVHKHMLLAWMLSYMTRKPKPLSYLETHAGRGLYDLTGAQALKTGEAEAGIGQFEQAVGHHPLGRALADVRAQFGAHVYPGSPMIADTLLRSEDQLTLAELHPQEFEHLHKVLGGAHLVQEDGFAAVLSRTPPQPRRGLMLCDPSYEIKADYGSIPEFFAKVHRKWGVGVLVLWYPILADGRQEAMVRALQDRFDRTHLSEVQFAPAKTGHGMIGSGIFVVNPPYGFAEYAGQIEAMFAALPR